MTTEEKLDKIINELHRVKNKLNVQSHTMDSMQEDLAEHMRRTEASEKRLAELEKWKYYIFSAVVTASLLSSPLQGLAAKLLTVLK